MPNTCRFCGGPVRLTPIPGGRGRLGGIVWVHTETKDSGRRCRASRKVFGERLMDRRQPMLPGMEWAWRP